SARLTRHQCASDVRCAFGDRRVKSEQANWRVAGVLAIVALCAAIAAPTARADNNTDQRPLIFEDPYDPAPAEAFVSTDRSTVPTLSEGSPIAMQAAIAKYEYIVNRGGWQPIPPGPRLSIGSGGERVLMLRERLAITGDLRMVSPDPGKFDVNLDQAVRS